ncbi:MAG: EAL domain-containing protein [Pseudomonadota bacterium]
MRIHTVFISILLFATIVPSGIFGWWAYKDGVRSEFAEVSDRHLLIARNLGNALARYSKDIEAITVSVGAALLEFRSFPKIDKTLSALDIDYIAILDPDSFEIETKVERQGVSLASAPQALLTGELTLKNSTENDGLNFTPVSPSPTNPDQSVIYGYKMLGNRLLVAQFNTSYFVELGKSISFGIKGHAAIVDHKGNVLSHPLDSWIAERKNIAKVSAVSRMMAGETGVQQFYSPALKGDMIAGFTSVTGPGWGVMIPQPVEELYTKVTHNNSGVMLAIIAAIAIAIVMLLLMMRLFGQPIDVFTKQLRQNAKTGKLKPLPEVSGPLILSEFKHFRHAYNMLYKKIESANEEIRALAYTDSVTKLPNRAQFQNSVDEVLDDPEFCSAGGSLMFVDIDNFKIVNDLHGHEFGDQLLRAISQRLLNLVKNIDLSFDGNSVSSFPVPSISRIGGDEFAVFIPGLVEANNIRQFLDDLTHEVQELNQDVSMDVRCSASVGAAVYPHNGTNMAELMRSADIAMYQAKKAGKNQYMVYCEKLGEITENEIRTDFSKAIDDNQLVLEYQPKICTRRHVVSSAEALVRWNHPKFGKLSPSIWLPAIASRHHVLDLGEWVIDQSMCELSRWNAKGRNLKMAINVSPLQLRNRDIVDQLKSGLEKYGINPEMFELELTEEALIEHTDVAEYILNEISAMGIKISVDDFGTGYSNLSRLARLPIDFIKIDQSLTREALNNDKVSFVLDSTISLARKLDCSVVAEGIETFELAEFATAKGVNLLQGFLFSASLPREEFLDWVDGDGLQLVGKYAESVERRAAA